MDTGDFCLHADAKTGKAYIWFERPHFQLICATLTDDYTAVTEEYSVHYDICFPRIPAKRRLSLSGAAGSI